MSYLFDFEISCFMNRILCMPVMLAEVAMLFAEIMAKIMITYKYTAIKARALNFILKSTLLLAIVQVVLMVSQVYHTEKIEEFPSENTYFGNVVNGKAHGYGLQYDTEGNILYQGEWINGERKADKNT